MSWGLKTKLLTVALCLVAVGTVLYFTLGPEESAMDRFYTKFSGKVSYKIVYSIRSSSTVEYTNYVRKLDKSIGYHGGRPTSAVVVTGGGITTHDPATKLEKRRLLEPNWPTLWQILLAVRDGRTKVVKEARGITYFKVRLLDESNRYRWTRGTIAISTRSGRPREIVALLGKVRLVTKVTNIKRIPLVELRKEIGTPITFMDKESGGNGHAGERRRTGSGSKGKSSEPNTTSLGYTTADLNKFKAYTPYWLGERVDGSVSSSIASYRTKSGGWSYFVAYSKGEKVTIEINAFERNSEEGRSEWSTSYKVRPIKIQGHEAKLQTASVTPDIVLPIGKVLLRIDGNVYKPNEFVKLVNRYLQPSR